MKFKFLFILLFCSTVLKAQSPYFTSDSCDFSSSCPFIFIDTANQNIWQQGISNKSFWGNVNGVFTDSVNPYRINANSYFEFRVPFNNETYIWFTHKYETDSMVDGGYIEYFNIADSVWENVVSSFTPNVPLPIPLHLDTTNFYKLSDTLKNGNAGFSGTSNWVTSQIGIWWYPYARIGNPKSNYDTLKLRFHFISDSVQTNKAGWIIKKIILIYGSKPGGVENISSNNIASITPNPTTTSFIIQKSTPEKLNFQLYNLIGQNVVNMVLKENQTAIERNGLPSGAYLYSIRNQQGNMVQSGKVVFE